VDEQQGDDVNKLVDLVRENEKIFAAVQHNLREIFVSKMAKLCAVIGMVTRRWISKRGICSPCG
jgi:hypothetical protein